MLAKVERNSESSWRRHSLDEDLNLDKIKRPRNYYRLASESSKGSEDDIESIYSIQDKETDVVRDTSDTESKSDSDINDFEVSIEYDIASTSESEGCISFSSSDPNDLVLAAAAAVICDSDLDLWLTDGEDSDSSSEVSLGRFGFEKCLQCNVRNADLHFRYCDKCFQARKKFYPPRPRRRNRRKNPKANMSQNSIQLSTLQNCLSGMSQNSSVGSEQNCPELNLDGIHVPDSISEKGISKNEDISPSRSQSLGVIEKIAASSSSANDKSLPNRSGLKRKLSETDSDVEAKKTKIEVVARGTVAELGESKIDNKWSTSSVSSATSSFSSESSGFYSGSSQEKVSEPEMDRSESALCIFCNSAPKDSIFLHTNIAHRCSCYQCAKRILRTKKRCPICNLAVNKIVKIFTS